MLLLPPLALSLRTWCAGRQDSERQEGLSADNIRYERDRLASESASPPQLGQAGTSAPILLHCLPPVSGQVWELLAGWAS